MVPARHLLLSAILSHGLLVLPLPRGARAVGLNIRAKAAAGAVPPTTQSFIQSYSAPARDNPVLTPRQFLFISCPWTQKVVYARLQNFKSATGSTHALVDSGLLKPMGLAFDGERGFLYVADPEQQKIFRYRVVVTDGGDAVSSDGVQLPILSGHKVEWVAVDWTGDVYFSAPSENFVGKIPHDVIDYIADGTFTAEGMRAVSEKKLEAESLEEQRRALSAEYVPTEPPELTAHYDTMYEGDINPRVSMPTGVASDGVHLFWGNKDAETSGSVVRGEIHPKLVMATNDGNASGVATPYPATILANNVNTTYGVAKSSKMVMWTSASNGGGPGSIGSLYGVMDTSVDGTSVYTLANSFVSPRGLTWDGDQTAYVADLGGDTVWSLPVGRFADNMPLAMTVSVTGPFDVALLKESDPAWKAAAARWPSPISALFWCSLALALNSLSTSS